MFFSVIVPTHHRLESLIKTLQSLQNQVLHPSQFEVLLIPSPLDPCIKAIDPKQYPFPLTILSNLKDPYSGKSASFKRNSGAQNAKAPWLAFIDDDCIADKNWLQEAKMRIEETPSLAAIEGATQIPEPPKKTYTYKGLQRLSRSGGFQTCNMFYRKDIFLETGGFDLSFPFYLEDTDLAWTVLDRGHSIIYAPQCIVHHPVPAADVNRLLHNAFRTRLLPYLYKKHPKIYIEQKWKALHRFHWLFLALHTIGIVIFLMSPHLWSFFILVLLIGLLSLIYTAYQLRDCEFSFQESFRMFLYFTITPWISLIQLHRGNVEQKTFLWR